MIFSSITTVASSSRHAFGSALIESERHVSQGSSSVVGQRVVLGQLVQDAAATLGVLVLRVRCSNCNGDSSRALWCWSRSVVELLGGDLFLGLVSARQLMVLKVLLLLLRSDGCEVGPLVVVALGTRWSLLGRVGDIGRSSARDGRALGSRAVDQLLAPWGLLLRGLRLRAQLVSGLLGMLLVLLLLVLGLDTLGSRTWPLLLQGTSVLQR